MANNPLRVQVNTTFAASTRESLTLVNANNNGADQPAHPSSLVSAFVIRFLESKIAYRKHKFNILDIVLRRRDTKESTCLLRHITTKKSDLCQYVVRITLNTTLEK